MEIAMLVLTAIGVAAAIIAALPPLGFDVRIFGRPNMPLEGIPYFRARQAWRALVVALISLGVSVGAFYYFFRPRVVEKIVEKPVEKIVERVVPQKCPTSQSPPKATSRGKSISQTPISPQATPSQNCPNGICNSGSNLGTQSVNNFGPPPPIFKFTEEVITPLPVGGGSEVLKIHIKIDRAVPGAIVGVVMSGPIDMTPECWNKHKPSLMGTMEQQISITGPLTLGNGHIPNSFGLMILMPSAFTPDQELIATVVAQESVHVVKVFEVGQPYEGN